MFVDCTLTLICVELLGVDHARGITESMLSNWQGQNRMVHFVTVSYQRIFGQPKRRSIEQQQQY